MRYLRLRVMPRAASAKELPIHELSAVQGLELIRRGRRVESTADFLGYSFRE